jgi:hypothetical protein
MDFSKRNKSKIQLLLNKSWEDFRKENPDLKLSDNVDNDVYRQLKSINENAYFVMRI